MAVPGMAWQVSHTSACFEVGLLVLIMLFCNLCSVCFGYGMYGVCACVRFTLVCGGVS